MSAIADSTTMLRRNFTHSVRYAAMTLSGLLLPVLMMLMFVYIFGGAIGPAISAGTGGGVSYIDYLTPGILVMAVGAGSASTAVSVAVDMKEGIIARFRTMAISRGSVITGQVVGSTIRTLVSLALVIGVALLVGFRPAAGPVAWLGAIGLLALLILAFTWLAVAFGLVVRSAEGANMASMPMQFLPLVSSAFMAPDLMSSGIGWFAAYQPFTPIIDTLRGLLLGTPIGNSGYLAVGWCLGLTLLGFLWARSAFNRDPRR
ncbi:ABC transporter permease [Phytomonospora endophytica]|uniref:Transport permease protein n=1 Tax=Phytomonospora endophytica TaxID=714109 RepID=A0A841FJC5_9ACTN|nr:ABC transporter permease [Phytomonospora endophytica]MBB6033938.1 ABC-2 type transport system permease protein [Phytomonospora endophytica]GIG64541.1 transport permease protein [Phytomonospora endophytica]